MLEILWEDATYRITEDTTGSKFVVWAKVKDPFDTEYWQESKPVDSFSETIIRAIIKSK